MKELREQLEPLDWRYSAAIVGLEKYLTWLGDEASDWELKEDKLEYDVSYIQKSKFAKFVEYSFPDDMHHLQIEELLQTPDLSDDQISLVNSKMKGNTILKKVFKKLAFDGENAEEVLSLIEENREMITLETFRNKTNLYRNYCNTFQLFEDGKECCRLLGYYIDMPKKGKSISYNFNKANFHGTDMQVFDFIPFAFHGKRETMFINDNIELSCLVETNGRWAESVQQEKKVSEKEGKKLNTRQMFFKLLLESNTFITGDVEVIVKNPDQTFFETLYIRRDSLKILKSLKKSYKYLCFSIKEAENYWVDIQKEVTESILNFTLLDHLINYLLKKPDVNNYGYVINQLIKINIKIKGADKMDGAMKSAFKSAKTVVDKRENGSYKVPDNKLSSYNKKLTSAITFEDYDRFCKILLNLANYADESFSFAYDLFEDFEKNKEVAYTFVNALRRENTETVKEDKGGN